MKKGSLSAATKKQDLNEAEQHEGRGKGSGDAGRLVRHTQSPSEKSSAQCLVRVGLLRDAELY